MKAATWNGINKVAVEEVPDARILNEQDAVVQVRLSSVCGSDLHLLGGYVPGMREGDVIGHEFLGEVVEVGGGVRRHRVGDRVVVCSVIACGRCWYCAQGLYSCCDNSNTNPALTELMWGQNPAAIFGYSHAMGGFKGSHAQYTRVPFADFTAFSVPDGVDDRTAVFASDTAPTGWMAAELGDVRPGDVVAIWGCGAIGQAAARSAQLLGAARVIVIDEFGYRLRMAEKYLGVETIDFSTTEVEPELRERSGGRGPDVCIDAVGLEAVSPGPQMAYDKAKQMVRLETDRPVAARQAIHACRKGGTVFLAGVFLGVVDKFPLGAAMNKGLTIRGAQQHGERWIPMLLERMERGEFPTAHLATHIMPLDEAPLGYELFREKKDDCVRAVFRPDGASPEPA